MQNESGSNKTVTVETPETNVELFKDFTDRIKTYLDGLKWITKPPWLSPPVCSRYGWKCRKPYLLECVTCGAKYNIPDYKVEDAESYEAYAEEVLTSLKEKHGIHCTWPSYPSPGTFMKMNLLSSEETLTQFGTRVQSLLPYRDSLPVIKDYVYTKVGLGEKSIQALCKRAGMGSEDICQYGKSIAPLAALGWIITEKKDLKCNYCLRSIWSGWYCLLSSKSSQDENDENSVSVINDNENCSDEEISEDFPSKKRKIISGLNRGEPFDPLLEHRSWCLWLHNGCYSYFCKSKNEEEKQILDATSALPGWKIFTGCLIKNLYGIDLLSDDVYFTYR